MFDRELVFDIETDGLLNEVTVVHVLCITDLTADVTHVFSHQPGARPIAEGIAMLDDPKALLVAHNGIGYDLAVLDKLHGLKVPHWRVRDTMVLSRLVWPDLKQIDLDRRKKREGKDFPGQMIGRVSLEAWGYRLGVLKDEYRGDPELVDELCGGRGFASPDELARAEKEAYARRFERWNPTMEAYCVQDVRVTVELWGRIKAKNPSDESVRIETQVAFICARQERHGFAFDEQKAAVLYAKLAQRRAELEHEVRAVFKPRYLFAGSMVPKRDNKAQGYCEGAAVTKVKLTEFNPSSRDHVAGWLTAYYGWEPLEFTPDGKPKIDDEVIGKLTYPQAKPLKEYFMVVKRLGQLAEGKEAWLRHVGPDGAIHGRINTGGTVTGRMAHMNPNTGQVPACYSPWGKECRELWIARKGKVLVGADADALELRDLAGYMAKYDGGAYIETVLRGDKKLGTDMHSVNCRAIGMDPKGFPFGDRETGRDVAKTWFYAFIYGAGDEKLGLIRTRKKGAAAKKSGKATRDSFMANLPALGKLVDAVKKVAKQRGYLIGLDGRVLKVRSQHAALNTLLQSCGAVQMKKALCILDDDLQAAGWTPGVQYEFVANVHDEWQIEVDHDIADKVGPMAVAAIRKAGEFFNFRCPLDGAFAVGASWADTH
jgi:DNA polymerase-1